MIIGMYIGLAIAGILAMVRGRMQISKQKIVVGIPARLLGILGLTPLPLALLVGVIYTAVSVDVTDPVALQQFTQDNRGAFTLIEVFSCLFVGLLLFVIATMVAVSPKEADRWERKRRSVGSYDDESDDRPRRRRRDEPEDDDRPRRPRRDELDDEDDRPRGRRRDELDDDDDRPRRRDDLDDRAR
jgi:hypothetical protein